jgi:hypothetical protein
MALLGSKPCAAFDAAALNHSTTGFCRNTGTEPMSTGAVTRVWLVGSFWHISSILPIFSLIYKGKLEIRP